MVRKWYGFPAGKRNRPRHDEFPRRYQMERDLALRLGAFLFALLISAAAVAETVTICEQRVEFQPRFQPQTLPPEQKALWGIWDGTIAWGGNASFCHGLLIGRIDEQGRFRAIHAWNSAHVGMVNMAHVGTSPWDGTYKDGVILLPSNIGPLELRKISETELEGGWLKDGNRYAAKFKRRGPPPK